jgi:hypothetical protein
MERMTMPQHNEAAKQAILEVVANQLRDNNPPETKETYARLKTAGYSDEDARILIGQVVICEIFDVLKRGEVFNRERFVARLTKLPDEPYDD